MFDVSAVKQRYFPVKLVFYGDTGQVHNLVVEVEPPRLKTMRRLSRIASEAAAAKADSTQAMDGDPVAEMADAVRALLAKNKGRIRVPDEYIDAMDLDQLLSLLDAFFDWVNDARKNSPSPQPAK